MSDKPAIDAIILAGGAGRRLDGSDKGLMEYRGRPLVEYAMDSIAGQTDKIIISCNRNAARYREYCDYVTMDTLDDYQGPLAGMQAAAKHCGQPLVFVCPCDCPDFPDDIVEKLAQQLENDDAQLAVAHDGERQQNLFMVFRRELLATLDDYLASGQRSVQGWIEQAKYTSVDFSANKAQFKNINTPADL